MIDTILSRIRANCVPGPMDTFHPTQTYEQGVAAGRIEAYEDVLHLLGFYDDERMPRYEEI